MTFPFEITPSGKVAESDGVQSMLEQVQFVVSTTLGTRAMRPRFGSQVGSRVLDTMALPDEIRDSVAESVEREVPGAQVVSVDINADQDTGTLEVTVWVSPRREASDRTYSVSLNFGRVVEETRP